MLNKNGFTTPLHPYQIATWVIFCWHSAIPAPLIAMFQNFSYKISFLLVFYLSHVLVLIVGYLITKSNPSIKLSFDPLYLETVENMNFYCTICKSYVTKTSKHCGSCDRCVDGFDHHCKWLNNCIGQSNYRLFIALILLLEISEAILLGFELQLLTLLEIKSVLVLLIFDSTLNAIIIISIAYLLGIHAMLKYKGLTTYEYIKAARKKNELKVNPSTDEKKPEVKVSSSNGEVKRSIIKAINKTVLENPCSFSVAKSANDEVYHLTFLIRSASDSDSLSILHHHK